MPGIAVVIVAGGKGERVGGAVPKQYLALLGKPILRWTIEAFARHPAIDLIQVVIGANDEAAYTDAVRGLKVLPTLAGGPTRQHSVMHGLEVLAGKLVELEVIEGEELKRILDIADVERNGAVSDSLTNS